MSAESKYVQLIWKDTVTGELKQPLLAAPITIGREIDQMPEEVGGQSVSRLELNHQQISRFHALITVVNQQVYITDQSTNGTFLNGRPIRPGIQPLSSKDTLRIGPYKMTATLIKENDLDATERNREQTNLSQHFDSLPKNTLVIWLIGFLVLLLMGIGVWFLVTTVLKNSRPEVPATQSSLVEHGEPKG
ncbi:MAG: FHA domain-containing protein [Symploca sp. SIO1A3]|nr:FHA domain-containing protein [Symploca sp. SIO2C1]NER50246.1 FHA domain-containing protein [Symploca sp. SIO1A3]